MLFTVWPFFNVIFRRPRRIVGGAEVVPLQTHQPGSGSKLPRLMILSVDGGEQCIQARGRDTTVLEVKQCIEAQTGMAAWQQSLTVQEQPAEMPDHALVSECAGLSTQSHTVVLLVNNGRTKPAVEHELARLMQTRSPSPEKITPHNSLPPLLTERRMRE